MEASTTPPLHAPRHWPTWLGLALLWCFSRVASYPLALAVGRRIGRLGYRAAVRRRRIARTNIALCLPELNAEAQEKVVREHFEAIGISLLMTGFSWWGSDEKLKPLAQTEGFQYLEQGLEAGRGVLLVGMHFVDLDLIGRLLGHLHPFAVMYRQHENPVIEWAFRRNRERRFSQAIPRGDVRAVLRALRQNRIVWLAPDQAMKGKHSVLAPFFGVPAATSTIISRIAGVSGATVMLGYGYRLPGSEGYRLVVRPPLEDFPGESVSEDTARVNLAIEAAVRQAPAQYLWAHRRFKKRKLLPDPY
ncbi:MAG: LpxL/LpxP family Kdo(2)-lipid IV(A) lauroyl/palmitoleoyl acyltransferase [Gammaproteobacteria bacterium]|nr:LpxL/LpxP family Kdo(2)-lipid IV(A) lauroyl/palmitoleoyl acyltransferase [Gammaproteobacteria bacterium]